MVKNNPSLEEVMLRQYMNNVPRPPCLRLRVKDDMGKVFKRIRLNKNTQESFSRFLTFLDRFIR